MIYNSFSFIIFVFVILFLYYTVFRTHQRRLLLAASILFYCFSGPRYLLYVLTSSSLTYACARCIGKIYSASAESDILSDAKQKERKAKERQKASKILKFYFLIILGIFIILKYFNFLSSSICSALSLFHAESEPVLLKLVLPLGLSYYTFTNIGYILDVYWRKIPAETNWGNFTLFTIYFPHIVQGPIARYGQLAPQFLTEKTFHYEQMTSGLQLMLWGLFKKMVIADRLNIFVSQIYGNYQNYSGVIFIVATILYSIQIYADFSGCMDIVSGISEAFGISLAKNFDHPYFSRSIPEFWRRWHITLGTWFKDYVFYPVSRSELCKKFNKWTRKTWGNIVSRTWSSVIPLVAVWLLTGIWHGAAWKYVAWGLFHGILIIGGTIFASQLQYMTEKFSIQTDSFSWHLFQMIRTFTLCCIGRVFFRAADLKAALSIFRRTFRDFQPWVLFDGSLYTYGLDRPNFILALFSIGILLIVSLMQERFQLRQAFARQNIIFRWGILYIAIFSIFIFGIYGPGYNASQFIYNQF